MKHIVCAYDFSPAAENALKHATHLAARFCSTLSIINIYNVPVPVTEFGYIDISDEVIKKNAVKELERIKSEIIAQHLSIVDVNVVVENGLVSYKLNKLAKQKSADLIVMGIDNERNFVKEHVLGSASIEEARESKIPVMIIPINAICKKIKSIAFACDYKNALNEASALIQVKYYATVFEAKLNVVHVLEPGHQISIKEAKSDKFIEDTLGQSEHKTYFVYESNVSEGVIDFVKAHEIDLVIVEPQHHGFFERLFSKSTTKELAFHLHVPLLTLHS